MTATEKFYFSLLNKYNEYSLPKLYKAREMVKEEMERWNKPTGRELELDAIDVVITRKRQAMGLN